MARRTSGHSRGASVDGSSPMNVRNTKVASRLVACLALAWAGPAAAHGAGLSYLDLKVDGARVEAALDIPAPDLQKALAIDANRDGIIDRDDVAAASRALGIWLATGLRLVSAGNVCRPSPGLPELRDDALVTVRASWSCDGPVERLELSSRLLETFGDGHSTFVRAVRGEVTAQALLNSRERAASLDLLDESGFGVAGRFVLLGVEHIFTGVDHVLFLLALLLLGGPLRRVIGIVTAFTVAHSVTLSLAALDVVALPERLVESAIALSIAYVAVEDWVHAEPRPATAPEPLALKLRWVVTFAFGLVHGFGFAGVLSELGLPKSHQTLSLAAFNFGVELGQVAIVAVAYPLLARAGRTMWYRPRGVQLASLAMFGAAVYWFVERAF
jgi:hydrogenase/urease accessory protein HupE